MDTTVSLDAVLTAARADGWPPDAVIASGDISHDGSAESYERARPLLEAIDAPVYCLAGNHDDPALMRELLCCGRVRMDFRFRVGSWQVVCLHTPIAGEDHGAVEDRQFRQLAAAMQEPLGRYTLVTMHHGPLQPCPARGCNLDDAGRFLKMVERYDAIRAVTWGHIHTTLEGRHEHIALLATPSTCVHIDHSHVEHQIDFSKHGYRWFELYDDGRLESNVGWAAPTHVELAGITYVPKP